jgi:predicted PurR-regulated permease PerM
VTERLYARRIVIAVAIVGFAILLVRVAYVLVLAFAGAVIAIAVRALSLPLSRHAKLSERAATIVVLLVIFVALVGGSFLFGKQALAELSDLVQRIPTAIETVQSLLKSSPLGPLLGNLGAALPSELASYLPGLTAATTGVLGFAGEALLVVFVAVYLAVDPGQYVRGFVDLLPSSTRGKVRSALGCAAHDVRKWLLGQAIEMACVALLSGVGLWLLGVPLAFALGVLAGALDFVPFVGPIAAAVVAVLIATAQSPMLGAYTILLFFLIQEVEAHLLVPLVQQWAASLPPVITLLAVFVFGLLFGLLGVLVATPLAVVLMSLTRSLYVGEVVAPPATRSPDTS